MELIQSVLPLRARGPGGSKRCCLGFFLDPFGVSSLLGMFGPIKHQSERFDVKLLWTLPINPKIIVVTLVGSGCLCLEGSFAWSVCYFLRPVGHGWCCNLLGRVCPPGRPNRDDEEEGVDLYHTGCTCPGLRFFSSGSSGSFRGTR